MLRCTALFFLLAVGLAACGGGGEGTKQRASTPSAEVQQYCRAALAIETVEPNFNLDALTPEQQVEESKKFATQSIRPLADQMVANAPQEIRSEISVRNRAVREVENTGNFEVFDRPDVVEASRRAHAYDVRNCGWGRVDVTAVDYSFGGVPRTLKAGPNSFDLTNNGREHHEAVIFRKNDGTTETFDQLLAMPQDEAERKVTYIASTDALPKQQGAYTVANLRAGQYAMVCFIPVGSTPEAEQAAEAAMQEIQGPPHFTRGMKSEFTVR